MSLKPCKCDKLSGCPQGDKCKCYTDPGSKSKASQQGQSVKGSDWKDIGKKR